MRGTEVPVQRQVSKNIMHKHGWRRLLSLVGVFSVVAVLAGCGSSGIFAPITSLSDLGVNGTYRVQPGDTLSSISRETGVSVEQLASLNGLDNPNSIRVGQRLRLSADAPVSSSVTASSSSAGMARASSDDDKPQDDGKPTRAADANQLNMVWPVKGKIIQGFTTQTKGIDIEGKVGEPVKAAIDGEVVFAGNAVRGFGNLVIIDHGGGFITAYAHNEKLMVNKGDKVNKGQQIATLGQTGTTSPRLHFEVRRNGTPVNPLRYLPEQAN